ncbi:ABC transporter ATP-binding protein [uncultured Roseovarius sp.]|uniref:ABC transporter ATP-binding protein n=1 Tax=uncultured Roseovarius sp. TaxID=293344 RepID=UPI0025F00852|nr:ABC transporter ATP-binding protein [uncultured Roseovarius sp.]
MTDPVLATHGITKSFGAVQASRDISLSLQPGEIHAVIGPNGAGKSTLIAQICGGLAPDAGRVEFLGQDVTPLPTRKRAAMGLARTFQISALAMEDTVLQNVTLGALGARGGPLGLLRNALKDQDLHDKAMTALDRVGLAGQASTVTAELSHGQRRQLEVAVALTLSPRAFVMDEPMAGMGTEGSHRMTAFLGELRDEAPILLVEHDMDAVFALADRLSVLVYGEIIATGTVDEIRNNPQVRAAYLGETA